MADFSSGKFSRAEDVGSNFDSMARAREPADGLGHLESKAEPGHGEYELVDIRQQQMLGNDSIASFCGLLWTGRQSRH